VLDFFVMATGDLNRRLPTGGTAKGIPKNLSVPFDGDEIPRNIPVLRTTSIDPVAGGAAQA